MATWTLQTSGAQGSQFRMSSGGVKTMGRATRADFVLDAPLVSRLHCRLEAGDESLEVVDLSSTNGIYVNGKRVKRAALASGDMLRIGRVDLEVQKRDDELA